MSSHLGLEAGGHAGPARALPEVLSMNRFVETLVGSAFDTPRAALHASGRGEAQVAFARQVAMYLCHVELGLSFSATGHLYGRDRTTASHACHVIEERREDASLDSLLDCLQRAIDLRRRLDADRRTAHDQ